MQIRCLNFGPIQDGTINLNKDLLILCGKNSAGKTYLTYLLYDLLNGPLSKGNISLLPDNIDRFIQPEQVRLSHSSDPFESSVATFEINLALIFLEKRHKLEQALAHWLKHRLPSIFPDTTNFENTSFEVKLPIDQKEHEHTFNFAWQGNISAKVESESQLEFAQVSYSKVPRQNYILFRATHGKTLQTEELTKEIIDIAHIVILTIALLFAQSYTVHEAYYFPAERLALDVFKWDVIEARPPLSTDMQARHMYAYMLNTQIGQNQGMPIRPQVPPDTDKYYPLPIRDFLIRASTYPFFKDRQGQLYNLGVELEQSINGQVSTLDDKQVNLTTSSGYVVPLKLTSSTVKSLTSFILYLKHEAKANHAVFFDEPELSLHPSLQRKVAVILAKLVQKGVKLVIPTHSDFMLREFNNLIMLFPDTESARRLRIKYRERGYSSLSTLNPDRVGVNLFGDGRITTATVSPAGFDVSAIDEEITDQNQITEDIYFSLF